MGINVLSLFDGISCCRVALNRANIQVDKYYASEIDKYAIQVAQRNYPNTIQLGDINNWRNWNIDWASIDLVAGGSPCQGFSNAGKGLNFDDPRSALFFVFVDILNHIRNVNPNVKFLLENVKMKKEWVNVITEYLGVEPLLINSSLVSGQVRRRLYWTNIPVDYLPIDKGINLIDVLQKNVEYKYYLSDKMIKYVMSRGTKNFYVKPEINLEKARPLTTAPNKRAGTTTYVSDDFVNGGDKSKIRRLTPIEFERLQNLPDNYTYLTGHKFEDGKRYKAIGNGWTVDVIAHIFSFLK